MIRQLPLLLMLCLSSSGQDKPTSGAVGKDVAKRIAPLIKMHEAWGPRTSTPGTSVTVKETARQKTTNGTAVTYSAFVSGLPKDKHYSMVVWPVDQQVQTFMEGVTIAADGQLICSGKTAADCGDASDPDPGIDFIEFAGLGEPKRMGLVSSDGKLRVFWTMYPFPIENRNGSCTLTAVRLSTDAEIMWITIGGLPPNSSFDLTSVSIDQKISKALEADAAGEFHTSLLPYVEGKASGDTTLTVKSAGCSPSIAFHWGKGTGHVE